MTSYNNDANGVTLQAAGSGSSLLLANLTSLTIANQVFSNASFQALSGGSVNLSDLTQPSSGSVPFESDGSGSQLNIPSASPACPAAVQQTDCRPPTAAP